MSSSDTSPAVRHRGPSAEAFPFLKQIGCWGSFVLPLPFVFEEAEPGPES